MGTRPTDADLDAIRDIIERSTLREIEHHELGARWTGPRGPEPEDPELEVQLQHRLDDSAFGIRMVGTVGLGFGQAEATVAAVYDYEGDQPEMRALLAFANEVAVMTLFPYFREAIGTITSKVFGEPLLVPVLNRGEIGFDLDALPE